MIYKFNNHEIELFDSIHNLRILRFQRFNKYQMQACEIGNTFEDYDYRTAKAIQFIKKGMTTEAIQELENRRQTVFNAYNNFTPIGKSLAVLIKRIDETNYDTFSPDDLDRCLEHLDRIGFEIGESIEKLKEVKKKIETELVVYYPEFFPKNGDKEQTALRVRRVNNLLDGIINGEFDEDGLFTIEKEILEHDKPNNWNVWVSNNMERTLEVDFQKFGIAVAERTNQKLEEMMTFTFYATLEHLKEKNPKKNGINNF